MEQYSIGSISRKTGVRPSAIRYYESLGLLPRARRVGGWRQFNPDAVDCVRVIRSAQELGFSLDEIRTLLYGYSEQTAPSARWMDLARKKLPEVDDLIRRATAMKRLLEAGLECECRRIEDCFMNDCASGDSNEGVANPETIA